MPERNSKTERARLAYRGYDPVVSEKAPLPASAVNDALPARRQLRILIADDERDQVATLAAILNDEGHEVREVYRGTEVLRMIANFEPDVALIDIGMPGMTGYDVAREVRAQYGKSGPLLIAVTGWKKPSDRILAQIAGFDHHLGKPFEAKLLLDLLEPLAAGSARSHP